MDELADNPIVYTLDHADRIISVGGPWDEFACDNGGETILSSNIIGQSILTFISGDVTRMWICAVLQHVRACNKLLDRPYRCDSPGLKRFMQMRAVPEGNRVIRLEHRLISTEQRTVPVNIQHCGKKSTHARTRCSVCGYIKTNSMWTEPTAEQYTSMNTIYVTYSICEKCSRSMSF